MNTPALNTFRGDARRTACAHAVLHAWMELRGARAVSPRILEAVDTARPPPGRCGALLALAKLAPERRAELERAFLDITGDTRCRDLDQPDTHPCRERIEAALALLKTTPDA